ncbi:hypothetical protein BDA99DRAFT_77750 [Phascolomyces articulosus]|uniref:Uncharacterized protein n=1 Tax=Phascolomyces articulosus TaxID=60185 RepID=A0AAD5PD48_9FUNG|nr:hypothetical protein BDA99DRAFT_77750 [Phascolomyces articulosus]
MSSSRARDYEYSLFEKNGEKVRTTLTEARAHEESKNKENHPSTRRKSFRSPPKFYQRHQPKPEDTSYMTEDNMLLSMARSNKNIAATPTTTTNTSNYQSNTLPTQKSLSNLTGEPTVRRRKSLIGSFDLKFGRSKSRQQQQQQEHLLSAPEVPSASSSYEELVPIVPSSQLSTTAPPHPHHVVQQQPVRSSSNSMLMGQENNNNIGHGMVAPAGADPGVNYDNYYQPALRAPFDPEATSSITSSIERNPSMDSNISKVSTYEYTPEELYSTISTANHWLEKQQAESNTISNSSKDKGKGKSRSVSHHSGMSGIIGLSSSDGNSERMQLDQEQMLYNNSTTQLRPRARSLRDKTRQQQVSQEKLKPTKEETPATTMAATTTSTSTTSNTRNSHHRASRSRSRVLRSPPPPQANAVDDVPPSLPNVDVRQIKNEINATPNTVPQQPPPPPLRGSSLAVSANNTPATASKESVNTAPNTPTASTSNKAADHHLTANVIYNVKRRLSLGKDRSGGKSHSGNSNNNSKETLDLDRKSLPANFASNREPRKRTLSNGSTLKTNSMVPPSEHRRKSGSNTAGFATIPLPRTSSMGSSATATDTAGSSRRSGNNTSPVPPLPSHQGAHITKKRSQEDIASTTRQQLVPPVPPVPRHHSLAPTTADGKRSSKTDASSRASSSSSFGRSGLSGDEQQQQQHSTTAATTATKRSLRRQISHGSSIGDTEDSDTGDKRVTRTKKKSITEEPVGKPTRPSNESGFVLWNPNKNNGNSAQETVGDHHHQVASSTKKSTINNTTTRRRGQTLPGSLATPPPLPTAPLPPMKVEPLNMTIPPEGTTRRKVHKSPAIGQKATTPTRIPMSNTKTSFSATTTPVGRSGTSSEEEIIYGDGNKVRRKKPERRLSRSKSGSGGKSPRVPSSTGTSPRARPKHTSSSTTTNSSDGGGSGSRDGKTSSQLYYSTTSNGGKPVTVGASPRLGAQTIAETGRTRKTSTTAATAGSLGRATSLHVPTVSSRKSSRASSELDPTDKGKYI